MNSRPTAALTCTSRSARLPTVGFPPTCRSKAWDEALTAGLAQAKNYAGIAVAVADLGSADQIKATFTGFQKYLYDDAVA